MQALVLIPVVTTWDECVLTIYTQKDDTQNQLFILHLPTVYSIRLPILNKNSQHLSLLVILHSKGLVLVSVLYFRGSELKALVSLTARP